MDNKQRNQQNSWICESQSTLHHSPFMELMQLECRSSEDDRKHRFFVMRSRDWCNIIPVTEDGKVVLVKQFRVGIGEHTLEVPGGVADPTDEDIEAAAIREMIEETGYVPLSGAKCVKLGWTHPNPAILNNRCFSMVVGPVQKQRAQKLDHGEMIDVVEVPLTDIPGMIARGEISHALMLNAFFFLMMGSETGEKNLLTELERFTRA